MIVLDTGVLYAAADRRDQDHDPCVALLGAHPSDDLVLPAPVITECALLIRSRPAIKTSIPFSRVSHAMGRPAWSHVVGR